MNSISFLFSQSCILLLSADALTNVLSINQLLSSFSRSKRLLLLLRESISVFVSMFILHQAVIGVLHILKTPPCAIQTVGGLAVTLSGMRAILNPKQEYTWPSSTSLSLVTPLAVPLMIGPSWLAACCVLVAKHLSFTETSLIFTLSWLFISFTTILIQLCIGGTSGKAKILLATQTVLGLFVTITGTQILLSGLQQAFL